MLQPHERQQWEWQPAFMVWLGGAGVGNKHLVLQILGFVFELQIAAYGD